VLPLFAAFTAVFLTGCEIPYVAARVVYEDPTNFVRLDRDPSVLEEFPESQHNHPFTIHPEQIAELLRGLSVREHRNGIQIWISGEAPREPVFREEEIRLLAPRLSEALAQAKPDERVTFYLSQPQTSIKREITSGGLYVHGHELHFTLGNHRIIYGIPAYGMVYDRRYPMMPTAPKAFDLYFEPAGLVVKQERHLLNRLLGQEPDELVIDLRKLSLSMPGAA
jgi:hypothetical protein